MAALPLDMASLHARIKGWLELRAQKFLRAQGGGYLKLDGATITLDGSSRAYGPAAHDRAGAMLALYHPELQFASPVAASTFARAHTPPPAFSIEPPPDRSWMLEAAAERYPLLFLRLERLLGLQREFGYYRREPNPGTVLAERHELLRLQRFARRQGTASLNLSRYLEQLYFVAHRKEEHLSDLSEAVDSSRGLKRAFGGAALFLAERGQAKYEARAFVAYMLRERLKQQPGASLAELLEPLIMKNRRDCIEEAESVTFDLGRRVRIIEW